MTTMSDGVLSWIERRIMYRIEADQEMPSHRGYWPGLSDLADLVGCRQPRDCRALVNGLVDKGYIPFNRRGKRVFFRLLKPLSGEFRLQWNAETGEGELVRAF
jgi:hypothetical protein